jgi:hypothetical protein
MKRIRWSNFYECIKMNWIMTRSARNISAKLILFFEPIKRSTTIAFKNYILFK